MMNRRKFVLNTSLAGAGLLGAYPILGKNIAEIMKYKSNRPEISKRTFSSDSVEQIIKSVKSEIKDPQLYWIFENCFPNIPVYTMSSNESELVKYSANCFLATKVMFFNLVK